jgi:hypothetical protein
MLFGLCSLKAESFSMPDATVSDSPILSEEAYMAKIVISKLAYSTAFADELEEDNVTFEDFASTLIEIDTDLIYMSCPFSKEKINEINKLITKAYPYFYCTENSKNPQFLECIFSKKVINNPKQLFINEQQISQQSDAKDGITIFSINLSVIAKPVHLPSPS